MVKGMVKLRDVARQAKVSPATVSRAFNQPELLEPETLRRVQAVVANLGYGPHGAARALASRRSRTIGAVVPTLDNSIFANCIHALQQRLIDAGYTLLVSTHDYDLSVEHRIVRTLVERGIDGLVLVGTDHEEDLFRFLLARRTPYVLSWCVDRTGRHPCVGFDSFAAGKRLARYLVEAGHRDLAVIAGITRGNDRARDRLQGVRAALAEHGIDLPAHRVVERPYSLIAGGKRSTPSSARDTIGRQRWSAATMFSRSARSRHARTRGSAYRGICRSPDSTTWRSAHSCDRTSPRCTCRAD